MRRYFYTLGYDPDMVRVLYENGLDLRGQDLESRNWFCLTVRDSLTKEIGAVLACEFKTWFDVSFSAVIDDPQAISRKLLHDIFAALFSRARRITALVRPDDDHTEAIVNRLGFTYEGFMRRGYDGDQDALIYGMLIEDCKYYPGFRAVRSTKTGDGSCNSQNRQTPTHKPLPNSRLM